MLRIPAWKGADGWRKPHLFKLVEYQNVFKNNQRGANHRGDPAACKLESSSCFSGRDWFWPSCVSARFPREPEITVSANWYSRDQPLWLSVCNRSCSNTQQSRVSFQLHGARQPSGSPCQRWGDVQETGFLGCGWWPQHSVHLRQGWSTLWAHSGTVWSHSRLRVPLHTAWAIWKCWLFFPKS